jgi:hypothetical protein
MPMQLVEGEVGVTERSRLRRIDSQHGIKLIEGFSVPALSQQKLSKIIAKIRIAGRAGGHLLKALQLRQIFLI